jgi:hypothetical protein
LVRYAIIDKTRAVLSYPVDVLIGYFDVASLAVNAARGQHVSDNENNMAKKNDGIRAKSERVYKRHLRCASGEQRPVVSKQQ